MKSKTLDAKVAIITGAGQGIGAAIAHGYALAGAKVLLTGRTQAKVEEVASAIRAAGGEAKAVHAQAGDAADDARTIATALDTWGRIDVLVNNAHSFTDYLPLEDSAMADHLRTNIESAVIGSLQLMQGCYAPMCKGGGGSIINMGSSYGLRCEPGFLAYAASKEAVRALTRTAAREWGGKGIRVNTILPAALSPKAKWYLEDSGTWDAELAKIAAGRFGTPEDIVPMALFLASDASAYVTGQTIGVDGGSTML